MDLNGSGHIDCSSSTHLDECPDLAVMLAAMALPRTGAAPDAHPFTARRPARG